MRSLQVFKLPILCIYMLFFQVSISGSLFAQGVDSTDNFISDDVINDEIDTSDYDDFNIESFGLPKRITSDVEPQSMPENPNLKKSQELSDSIKSVIKSKRQNNVDRAIEDGTAVIVQPE